MSLLEKIQAEVTAIETYLLSYLPVDHHDQIRRAVAVAGSNIDAHVANAPDAVSAAVIDPSSSEHGDGVEVQTLTGDSAAPVQGELPVDTAQRT